MQKNLIQSNNEARKSINNEKKIVQVLEQICESLVQNIQSVEKSKQVQWKVKDDKNNQMEGIKIFQLIKKNVTQQYYYSIYQDNGQNIHLGQSLDLIKFQHVIKLDSKSSQPCIHENSNGSFLLGYEKTDEKKMVLRYYQSFRKLCMNDYQQQFDIPYDTLDSYSGCLSIDYVNIDNHNLSKSIIVLKYVYFNASNNKSFLALGTLLNFTNFHSQKSEHINSNFQTLSLEANILARSKFYLENKLFFLQECQLVKDDPTSHRIFICDFEGLPLKQIDIKTEGSSKSFQNPSITFLIDFKTNIPFYVVSFFIPQNGNTTKKETGQLIYTIQFESVKNLGKQDQNKSISFNEVLNISNQQ